MYVPGTACAESPTCTMFTLAGLAQLSSGHANPQSGSVIGNY